MFNVFVSYSTADLKHVYELQEQIADKEVDVFVADHIQSYLGEFAFRFNRRNSRAPGMLFYRLMELAAQADPVTYRELVKNPQPRPATQVPTHAVRHVPPRTLARDPEERPWRQ